MRVTTANMSAADDQTDRDPAFAYAAFRRALKGYLQRRLANPHDVEDVLQDVFLRVTRNEAALAATKEPLAWLYTVARTAALDHQRRVRKHAPMETGGVSEDIPDTSEAPDEDAFSGCMTPLIEALPERYRDAIQFVDLEGGRQTEFAQARGIGLSAAKSRVQRGRRQIKAALLACCTLERDALQSVTGLDGGNCDSGCC
ncbi:MAG: sigma-70 family RNA polymerase sigma factor [Pseudomonadota bacterium]